ncbi:non-ribosomal peptide synthetase [Sesbania bispinosa]|nr:non-ribosomal peptide synthetase [Sesbania bispinosa]
MGCLDKRKSGAGVGFDAVRSLMILVSRWCDGSAAMVVVGRLKMASERVVGSVLKPHHRRDKKDEEVTGGLTR